jgi:hypothetical protein
MFDIILVSWLEAQSGQNKDDEYNIGIYYFSAKHAAFKSKNKDWLAWHQDNSSQWSNMSIRRLLQ